MNSWSKRTLEILKTPIEEFHHVLGQFLTKQTTLCTLFDHYFSCKRNENGELIEYYSWLLNFVLHLKVYVKIWSSFRFFKNGLDYPWARRPVCLFTPFHYNKQQVILSNEDETVSEEAALILSYLLTHSEDFFLSTRADSHLNTIQWNFFHENEKIEEELMYKGKLLSSILFMLIHTILTSHIDNIYKETEITTLLYVLEDMSKSDHTKKLCSTINEIYLIYSTWYATKTWNISLLKDNLANKGYPIYH